MSEPENLSTRCNVPEECVLITTVDICGYLTPDGDLRWDYTMSGDIREIHILGLLERVKLEALRGVFGDEDDG